MDYDVKRSCHPIMSSGHDLVMNSTQGQWKGIVAAAAAAAAAAPFSVVVVVNDVFSWVSGLQMRQLLVVSLIL